MSFASKWRKDICLPIKRYVSEMRQYEAEVSLPRIRIDGVRSYLYEYKSFADYLPVIADIA